MTHPGLRYIHRVAVRWWADGAVELIRKVPMIQSNQIRVRLCWFWNSESSDRCIFGRYILSNPLSSCVLAWTHSGKVHAVGQRQFLYNEGKCCKVFPPLPPPPNKALPFSLPDQRMERFHSVVVGNLLCWLEQNLTLVQLEICSARSDQDPSVFTRENTKLFSLFASQNMEVVNTVFRWHGLLLTR